MTRKILEGRHIGRSDGLRVKTADWSVGTNTHQRGVEWWMKVTDAR